MNLGKKITMLLFFILILGSQYWQVAPVPLFIDSPRSTLEKLIQDAGIQLVVELILVTYLAVFLWIEYKLMQEPENNIAAAPAQRRLFLLKHALFITFLMVCVFSYLTCFDPTSSSTDLLVLLTAMVIGKGFATWNRKVSLAGRIGEIRRLVLDAFVLASAFCGLIQPNWENWNQLYKYHDYLRWSGLFSNPDNFGVMMGVGVVASTGLLVTRLQHNRCFGGQGTFKTNGRYWAILIVACSIACLGLLKSFSRGAWLGALLGLVYLGVSLRTLYNAMLTSCKENAAAWRLTFTLNQGAKSFLKKEVIASVAFILLAGFLFVSAGHAGQLFLKRTLSVGNTSDLSWRNRVSAYIGALQMINDRPWAGFGWNKPEVMYAEYYMDPRMIYDQAILLNDYFMVGMSVGLPALIAFIVYVRLSFATIRLPCNPNLQERTSGNQGSNNNAAGWITRSETVVCRANAIVLLVGFWFDRGLFFLASAVVFWIYLELSVPD